MKKPIRNILAKRSTGEIAYLCSKCHNEVDKEAKVCEHCGAKLGKIKCPFCNFIGSVEDFKYNTCPKCGRKRTVNIETKKRTFGKSFYSRIPFSTRLFWFLFFLLVVSISIVFVVLLYNFDFL